MRLLAAAVTVTAYCLWAFERSAQVGRGHHPIWFELSIVPFVIAILHVELRFASGGRRCARRDGPAGPHAAVSCGIVWVVLVAVGIYS